MICHKCREDIPDISRYCLHCGTLLGSPAPSAVEDEGNDEVVDWENRILCSDGTCTGTIEEGKCTVCGKPGTEEPC